MLVSLANKTGIALVFIPASTSKSFMYKRNSLGPNIEPCGTPSLIIQKRGIRILTNAGARDSCTELFKKLEILPLYSQYIFSLSIFVIKININFPQIIRSILSTQD